MEPAGFGANVAQSVSGQIMKLLSGMAYHESVTAMMSLCIGLCARPSTPTFPSCCAALCSDVMSKLRIGRIAIRGGR